MPKLTRMDRATAKMVGVKAEAALQKALKTLGLEVVRGNSRFDSGSVTMKFECSLPKARKASKKQDSLVIGFSKNILGEQFVNRGTSFTIIDIKPSRPKYPIVGQNARGTKYKFQAESVARQLVDKSIKFDPIF